MLTVYGIFYMILHSILILFVREPWAVNNGKLILKISTLSGTLLNLVLKIGMENIVCVLRHHLIKAESAQLQVNYGFSVQ